MRKITEVMMLLFAIFAAGGSSAESTASLLPGSTDENVSKLVKSNNATGLDLYSKLRTKKGNIVISPYSIGTAMTMALAGADGGTAKEMSAVMHQNLAYKKMNIAAGDLYKKLNSLNSKDITLETANGLCLVKPDLVSSFYKNLLRKYYFAELFSAKNVKPVNDWVNDKTHGKIPKILNTLPGNTLCVILNAIYFKGLWASQFKKTSTFDADFFLENGKKIKTPMMHQSGKFPMTKNNDFSALEMPFKGKRLSFIIILPGKGAKLADFEKTFDMSKATSIIAALKKNKNPAKVDIAVPKFKIDYDTELKPPFMQLGMKEAFSAKLADFGKLTGVKNRPGLVWIAQIKHKAFIEINEEGGEAAAATAVVMRLKCASVSKSFTADRPFLFLIKDTATDSILFLGRVANPQIGK
jgi:serpin B